MANVDDVVPAAGFARGGTPPQPPPDLPRPAVELPPLPGSGARAEAPLVSSEPRIDPETLRKRSEEISKLAESLGLRLRFGVRDTTGDLFVQLIDARDQVVKTVPMEALLELREKLQEHLGVFVDQEA